MIHIRKSDERFHSDHGWLNSHHTFSFGAIQDPEHNGFRSLRVINDDHVAAGRGFGLHGHRDMEILSYVVDGKLAHKDSMGYTEVLGPNEIQTMSAGNGILHSEFNGSETEPVHFLQIWIEPRSNGTKPAYEQIAFDPLEKQNRFRLLAGPELAPGVAQINQDARVLVARISPGAELAYPLQPGRHAWVHVVSGQVNLNGIALRSGDGAAISDEASLSFDKAEAAESEVLVFDLA
jgi:quercetin 2,3-dioxygenase